MDIQTFINKRIALNYQQETSLIELLGYKQSSIAKQRFKSIVKNRFYSSFDNQVFSKDFIVYDLEIVYKGNDIKAVREILIKLEN